MTTHMRSAEPRRRWTEAEARAVLEDWRASGLSAGAFAAARGLNPQRLYWWKKRLSVSKQDGGDLVPVHISPSEPDVGVAMVRLPRGVVLEVDSAWPPGWIAALAVALERD